jgi:simple sugar transport system ATP-binding protein
MSAILAVEDLSLAFGSVQALRDVTLALEPGEITALVGDNGAGKSTLVRCMSGVHRPDSGRILLDGEPVQFRSAEDARHAGIETVHQNLALVEDLTVWQNLFLNRAAMRKRAQEMVSELAVNVPAVVARVRRLSGGQRQAVAICRAAGFDSRLVIMDEPTAALGVQETERVENLIRGLRDKGRAVLLISHDFQQVLRLSDQVWVMRSGRCVGGRRTSDTTGEEIVSLVTGALAA